MADMRTAMALAVIRSGGSYEAAAERTGLSLADVKDAWQDKISRMRDDTADIQELHDAAAAGELVQNRSGRVVYVRMLGDQ